ncbi:serine/arginine repetitive matrix protein 1-like [Bos javanicus]|uniref:serine/arginine repetitive matrix protein 1-like n=1 Tax=Bos javanicus TaxID=9906 RepID=UPI002AA6DE2F|nr:serine/arginine repetitive matrix protein 1-like [Bos javanicus]
MDCNSVTHGRHATWSSEPPPSVMLISRSQMRQGKTGPTSRLQNKCENLGTEKKKRLLSGPQRQLNHKKQIWELFLPRSAQEQCQCPQGANTVRRSQQRETSGTWGSASGRTRPRGGRSVRVAEGVPGSETPAPVPAPVPARERGRLREAPEALGPRGGGGGAPGARTRGPHAAQQVAARPRRRRRSGARDPGAGAGTTLRRRRWRSPGLGRAPRPGRAGSALRLSARRGRTPLPSSRSARSPAARTSPAARRSRRPAALSRELVGVAPAGPAAGGEPPHQPTETPPKPARAGALSELRAWRTPSSPPPPDDPDGPVDEVPPLRAPAAPTAP